MRRIRTPERRAFAALMLVVAAAAPVACTTSEAAEVDAATTAYGDSVRVGNGTARVYIDTRNGAPAEVGIALTEAALTGLPTAGDPGGVHSHGSTRFDIVLDMPSSNPTPYEHVLLNYNPGGHEPPGIYDLEHFDVHFYTVSNERRLTIDEADPEFQRKAERVPAPEYIPEGYILPEPLGFGGMGVHWVDPKSPELNGQKFTHTFIYGTWDGELIFGEPMITKAFLESKPDVTLPLPAAARSAKPGYYPSAYRVRWDEGSKEYRIALTGLTQRD